MNTSTDDTTIIKAGENVAVLVEDAPADTRPTPPAPAAPTVPLPLPETGRMDVAWTVLDILTTPDTKAFDSDEERDA